jgi:hypothetical protein
MSHSIQIKTEENPSKMKRRNKIPTEERYVEDKVPAKKTKQIEDMKIEDALQEEEELVESKIKIEEPGLDIKQEVIPFKIKIDYVTNVQSPFLDDYYDPRRNPMRFFSSTLDGMIIY